MPDRAILAYYDAVAPKILPFLRGRFVAVRHHFDDAVVFRRHRIVGGRKTWIRISSKRELLAIVHQHGYEFFPHLEGDRNLWFALDIDVRSVPTPLGKIVVRTVLEILAERRVRSLLTFSGGNGFHIRWAFVPRGLPRDRWGFLRSIVRNLRTEAEERLQISRHRPAFYQHIPAGDPITELNAVDKAAQRSVLFDELILKRAATIRAPFSLHMQDRLTAIPVAPDDLARFVPSRDAQPSVARRVQGVRLPFNPVARFLEPPWTRT